MIFRAKLRDRLKQSGLFSLAPDAAWSKAWVVHCQHAGSGSKVLDYLARYVFRIAISNSRLDRLDDDGQVRFRYRHNHSHQMRTVTLPAEEFIGRFLEHVLPRGLTKVRYHGLYSASSHARLEKARSLLTALLPSLAEPQPPPPLSDVPKSDAANPPSRRCPTCRVGELIIVEVIPRARAIPP